MIDDDRDTDTAPEPNYAPDKSGAFVQVYTSDEQLVAYDHEKPVKVCSADTYLARLRASPPLPHIGAMIARAYGSAVKNAAPSPENVVITADPQAAYVPNFNNAAQFNCENGNYIVHLEQEVRGLKLYNDGLRRELAEIKSTRLSSHYEHLSDDAALLSPATPAAPASTKPPIPFNAIRHRRHLPGLVDWPMR